MHHWEKITKLQANLSVLDFLILFIFKQFFPHKAIILIRFIHNFPPSVQRSSIRPNGLLSFFNDILIFEPFLLQVENLIDLLSRNKRQMFALHFHRKINGFPPKLSI